MEALTLQQRNEEVIRQLTELREKLLDNNQLVLAAQTNRKINRIRRRFRKTRRMA
jgi:hypothetical protein